MTALKEIRVEARVVLASHRLRLRDLLRLERGSMVPLGGHADLPSTLQVNGVAIASGQVTIEGETTAFAIRDIVARD